MCTYAVRSAYYSCARVMHISLSSVIYIVYQYTYSIDNSYISFLRFPFFAPIFNPVPRTRGSSIISQKESSNVRRRRKLVLFDSPPAPILFLLFTEYGLSLEEDGCENNIQRYAESGLSVEHRASRWYLERDNILYLSLDIICRRCSRGDG